MTRHRIRSRESTGVGGLECEKKTTFDSRENIATVVWGVTVLTKKKTEKRKLHNRVVQREEEEEGVCVRNERYEMV